MLTTRAVVDALAADGGPRVLVNASGVDIYGARDDAVDESSPPGQGFLPETASRGSARRCGRPSTASGWC